MAEQAIGVGLVGCGTIGCGVVQIFQEQGDELARRLGFPLELRAVVDLDLSRERHVSLDRYRQSRDWRSLVRDPDIDVVIELVGGTTVAREVVLGALEAGRGVVTANKALLAHCGDELYQASARTGADLLFEASVAGTIPVLRALREGLCADRIHSVHGIVNGTCNFILSEMDRHGESYEACLKRAQGMGFAEADPTFDVDGTDSAHKLTILAGLALGVRIRVEDIPAEGIERISLADVEYAHRFDLRIKLLAIAKRLDGAIDARVQPALVAADSVLAGIEGAMNAVEVRGDYSGPTLYCGAGAGSLPTASAVVADVIELARSLRGGAGLRVPPLGTVALEPAVLRSRSDLEGEFYVRFSVADEPGVLAAITGTLYRFGISIASMLQPERHETQTVPVIILTHSTKAASLLGAVAEIESFAGVDPGTRVLPIERDL